MKRLLAVLPMAMLAACGTSNPNLPAQAGVELDKYAGIWHEQARLPNRFQKDCVGDVQATYELHSDNTLGVINQCRANGGVTKVAEGAGRLSTQVEPRNPAKLQVRFAPKWMAWLPMVWGDYWILKLQGNYEYSLVGTPDREYLWVLSRERQADREAVQALIEHARMLDFPVERIIFSNE